MHTLDASKLEDSLARLYVEQGLKGLWYIKYKGGGEVSDTLKGSFTSLEKADNHLYFHILERICIPEKKKYGTSKRS